MGRGRGSPGSTSLGGKGPPLLLPSYLEAIYVCPVWGGNEGGGRVKSGVCTHTHKCTHTYKHLGTGIICNNYGTQCMVCPLVLYSIEELTDSILH